MTVLASFLPLICFLLYPLVVERLEAKHPTLSALMSRHRLRWVNNAVSRDTPMDAILSGNLMSSVSFFASTTVLLILALFAVFGQLSALRSATEHLQPQLTQFDLELHLAAVLAIFVVAFLAFTLSLRNFNHFCIMLGAVQHDGSATAEEIRVIAALNTIGARNFNHGIRAYYFAMASLAWFASPWLAIATTIVIIGVLAYREFFSTSRHLIDSITAK
ncbi:membrane protein [Youhaiella tibetensis]|uniref:DUF599 domain-containing protein n=1 Tax=Paradevosia tibetensis TaxID=1447062 RepID=A0A5B9DRP8_9HYPH|nr:DUF599 domain-containing protein [Youhaiella tibetensis]AKR57153.1 hypothetical protein XM25_15415 [Devosia sp. H5989]QEE22101.1 DUF599 domain-containing protein [Youhaiella tibetensis]GGF45375.1 membrane protein [Youhaiella tibetensis]